MRPARPRCVRAIGPQVFLRSRELACSNRPFVGPLPWPRGPRLSVQHPLPPAVTPGYRPVLPERLALIYSGPRPQSNRQRLQPNRKKTRQPARPYFRSHKRPQNSSKPKGTLNPSDPLNLQDLVKETERRRSEGLPPLRGDSRLNTPACNSSGGMGIESPMIQPSHSFSTTPLSANTATMKHESIRLSSELSRSSRNSRRMFGRGKGKRRLPLTGNYGNYYNRRDPNDRLPYLMPEWFNGKDVADYGCHNGTFTFNILERFPDIHHIDAIDCDADLIATARNMQRERLRWNTGSTVRYDKINFQVGNWVDQATPTDDPEYDTIVAFSVTKWIHINHGDAGLLGFFRRAFNLLKPGGHLILEPQPKSSYRRARFTVRQRSTYQTLKIDPTKLEPLLADLGFSYFDTIKYPRPNESFRRKIILCSKSYGATPASIRNIFRSEVQSWNLSPSPQPVGVRAPPPVCYDPQTPSYSLTPNALNDSSPVTSQVHSASTFVHTPPISFTNTERSNVTSLSDEQCEPDSTSAT